MFRYLLLVLFAQPLLGEFNIDFELKGAPEVISTGNNWGYGGMVFLHKIGVGGYDFRVWSDDFYGDASFISVKRHDFGFDIGYLLVSYLPQGKLKVEEGFDPETMETFPVPFYHRPVAFIYPFLAITKSAISEELDTDRYTEYSAGMSLTLGVSVFRLFLEPTLNFGESGTGGATMPIGFGWEIMEGDILFIKYDQLKVNGPLKSCWNFSMALLF